MSRARSSFRAACKAIGGGSRSADALGGHDIPQSYVLPTYYCHVIIVTWPDGAGSSSRRRPFGTLSGCKPTSHGPRPSTTASNCWSTSHTRRGTKPVEVNSWPHLSSTQTLREKPSASGSLLGERRRSVTRLGAPTSSPLALGDPARGVPDLRCSSCAFPASKGQHAYDSTLRHLNATHGSVGR